MTTQECKSDIKPFKMYGNLYFIGSSKVSVHLIETDEGLVLIDAGYPEMYEVILDGIEKLGFRAEDICAIFHSHGHYDHIGCTQELQKISGAKTYISRIDNDIVNGTYDLSWAKELGRETLPFFDGDVLIEDGDCFTFGKTTIRCRLTGNHPGQNDTTGKLKKVMSGESVIDSTEWNRFLHNIENKLDKMLAEE